MNLLIQLIGFGLLAATGNIIGGFLITGARATNQRMLRYLIALGAGFMLAAVFLEVIPEVALQWQGDLIKPMGLALAGYLLIQFVEHTIAPHFHFGEETHSEEMMRRGVAGAAVIATAVLAAGCSSLKPYPGGSPENVVVRSQIESGSFFSSMRGSVHIHALDAGCRTSYLGTVNLDQPKVVFGLPAERASYLVFVFDGSSFLGGSSSSSSSGTVLKPHAGYRYEVAVTLTLVSVILMAGTLSMVGIVNAQYNAGLWYIFAQPLAFGLVLIGGLAETNRAPFDLPEAEQELTGGFHTEYSGMRFALFFLAEYANMIVVSSVVTTLFLGGWLRPFPNVQALNFLDYTPVVTLVGLGAYCLLGAAREQRERTMEKLGMAGFGGLLILTGLVFALPPVLAAAGGVFWFLVKVVLGLYTFIWIRFTLPRYRYDQLMRIGWRWLIPLAIANVIITGIVMQLTA